jgi:hypothetical protein
MGADLSVHCPVLSRSKNSADDISAIAALLDIAKAAINKKARMRAPVAGRTDHSIGLAVEEDCVLLAILPFDLL